MARVRLAKARKNAGMSQAELADALGGHVQSMVAHIEAGRRHLRYDDFVNAGRALGVSLDYLAGLTDDPTPAVSSKNGSHAVSAEAMMLGQRLADARKRAGLSQVELAVALGDRYDHSVISRVESGQSGLRIDGLANAAAELNVSVDWLLGLTDDPTASRNGNHADGEYPVPEKHANIDTRPVAETKPGYNLDEANDQAGVWNLPVREVRPAAGSGAEVFGEEVVGYVPFRADWLKERSIDPAQADIVQVSGPSMEPTLPDGCSILVDRSRRELQPKHIYVLRNEDGLVVKRVGRNREGWWVISDNPAWLPLFLTEETDVIGEVRWAARTFS